MKTHSVVKIPFETFAINKPERINTGNGNFASLINNSEKAAPAKTPSIPYSSVNFTTGNQKIEYVANQEKAVNAYKANTLEQQIRSYVEDQLLSNPGGDRYDLTQKDGFFHKDPSNWKISILKDIKDALENIKNFFLDFTIGSTFKYKDKNGQIHTARKRGLLQSVVSFFKNVISGISFGLYTPKNRQSPSGFTGRIKHFFKSLYSAFFTDIVEGVGSSVNHMTEDLALGVWNAIETVPDSTIGITKPGRKITTKIFDGGQVIIDYATDVLPGGEGWLRVHGGNLLNGKLPIITNLQKPTYNNDPKWKYVRNTSFRKAIETIGSIITDVMYFLFIRKNSVFGNDNRKRKMET